MSAYWIRTVRVSNDGASYEGWTGPVEPASCNSAMVAALAGGALEARVTVQPDNWQAPDFGDGEAEPPEEI